MWSTAGACLGTLVNGDISLWSLCPLTDGTNRLLSGDRDGVVRLHDMDALYRTVTVVQITRNPAAIGAVIAIVELPGGRFASVSHHCNVVIRELDTGEHVATLRGHTAVVTALALAGESTLVSGSLDETVRLRDIHTFVAIATIEVPSVVSSMERLADGSVASCHRDGVVRLWDVDRCEIAGELRGELEGQVWTSQLADGRLICVDSSGDVMVWDVAARRCTAEYSLGCEVLSCCGTVDSGLALVRWDPVSYTHLTLPTNREV